MYNHLYVRNTHTHTHMYKMHSVHSDHVRSNVLTTYLVVGYLITI